MNKYTTEQERRKEESRQWAVQRFGIKPEEFVDYNSGCCYDRIWVNTKEAADKVSYSVKDCFVNGGFFDGMRLGGQVRDPNGCYNIMC